MHISRSEAFCRLLHMHYARGVGHLGGNLSALDVLLVLYQRILEPNDVFVLSKGHSAGALYVALWSVGRLSDHDLETFHADNTILAGHPPAQGLSDVHFATGSLGHGLPIAAGCALSAKLRGASYRVYCLMSDGEWQEGSNWEACIFSVHHKLSNLTVLVDLNGLQGFGTTKDVASMDDLAARLARFNLDLVEIDGHDPDAIERTLLRLSGGPRVVILKTCKGFCVPAFEGRFESHYLPLTEKDYRTACALAAELET